MSVVASMGFGFDALVLKLDWLFGDPAAPDEISSRKFAAHCGISCRTILGVKTLLISCWWSVAQVFEEVVQPLLVTVPIPLPSVARFVVLSERRSKHRQPGLAGSQRPQAAHVPLDLGQRRRTGPGPHVRLRDRGAEQHGLVCLSDCVSVSVSVRLHPLREGLARGAIVLLSCSAAGLLIAALPTMPYRVGTPSRLATEPGRWSSQPSATSRRGCEIVGRVLPRV